MRQFRECCLCFQQLQDMEDKRIHRVQECILQCAEIEKNVIPIVNTCIEGMAKAAGSVNSAQVRQMLYGGVLVQALVRFRGSETGVLSFGDILCRQVNVRVKNLIHSEGDPNMNP